MDFDLNDQQTQIRTGLEQLIGSIAAAPPHEGVLAAWSEPLDSALDEAGYYGVVASGLDLIDGALVVERLAQLAVVVESAISVLVAPATGLDLPRPFALATDPLSPARYLPVARTLLVDRGDHFLAMPVEPSHVVQVHSLFAYPYGRLRECDAGAATRIADAATLRRRWRIANAVEAAGAMRGALDLVLDHVKTRRAFGRALGSFQAIQHRLVMAAEVAESSRWLALRAAWSDSELDAATACTFVQDATPRFVTDLHQFCGAMGLTLEFPLHYFTYRLRALLGELGGSTMQARAIAAANWGEP